MLRVRHALRSETRHSGPATRIDWATLLFVRGSSGDVAPLIAAEHDALVMGFVLGRRAVWFDAKRAVGPFRLSDSERRNGFRTLVRLGRLEQRFVEEPEVIARRMADAGGNPLPL